MPDINKKALDRKVLLSDGNEEQLSQFWIKGRIAVLVFLRHFG